jgi:hypothetical protein
MEATVAEVAVRPIQHISGRQQCYYNAETAQLQKI